MKSKEVNNRFASSLKEGLSDLMEELSDEEAGACVGGLLPKSHIDIQLVDSVTKKVVGQTSVGVQFGNNAVQYDNLDSFRSRSDRNIKEHFAAVDVQEILDKVASLPIATWNYKDQNPAIRHLGPMAQDFAAAFGVGEDNRFINTVDANGVALAAIQGLYQHLQAKDAEISAMRAELNELKQQMLENKQQASITLPPAALNCN